MLDHELLEDSISLNYLISIASSMRHSGYSVSPLLLPHFHRRLCCEASSTFHEEQHLLVNAWVIHRTPIRGMSLRFKRERFEGFEEGRFQVYPIWSGEKSMS
ncbi:hypothetical protein LOK49_LG05G03364 [Camellia lanceoleosa]|uniref:Uncharacterized protein n=1 Tax=Camellia lanceoleosa TaxID=1840588 RepID=A0ACC0HNC3_9ERIC|nr:hypothetical protein LOK49_LG05G03364 [Camellia lanceoleosa]